MESLKQLLLSCQVYLQEGDWDKLTEALGSIRQEQIENLDLATAQECLNILEHLIKDAEDARNKIAENLVNLRKFKEGYSF